MPAHSSPGQCCGLLHPRTWYVVTSHPFHLQCLSFCLQREGAYYTKRNSMPITCLTISEDAVLTHFAFVGLFYGGIMCLSSVLFIPTCSSVSLVKLISQVYKLYIYWKVTKWLPFFSQSTPYLENAMPVREPAWPKSILKTHTLQNKTLSAFSRWLTAQ